MISSGYERLASVAKDEGNLIEVFPVLEEPGDKSWKDCPKRCDEVEGCNSFGYCPSDGRCYLTDKCITKDEPIRFNEDCFTSYKPCTSKIFHSYSNLGTMMIIIRPKTIS